MCIKFQAFEAAYVKQRIAILVPCVRVNHARTEQRLYVCNTPSAEQFHNISAKPVNHRVNAERRENTATLSIPMKTKSKVHGRPGVPIHSVYDLTLILPLSSLVGFSMTDSMYRFQLMYANSFEG